MALADQLERDLQQAIREQDVVRRETLRLLRNALRYDELGKTKPLTEDEVLAVVQRQAKQRRESIVEFRKGNRADLVEKEERELAILTAYLPQQMDKEAVRQLAKQAIQEVAARGPADKGRVMGKLMPQVRGKADGAVVSAAVDELLAALAKG